MKITRHQQSGNGISFPDSPTDAFLRDDGTWRAVPGGGDMLKSEYDANDDGVVDEATLASLRIITEQITITEGKVNHVLENVPGSYRKLIVSQGPECEYGVDYIINNNLLSWEDMELDGYLEVGQVLVFEYSY